MPKSNKKAPARFVAARVEARGRAPTAVRHKPARAAADAPPARARVPDIALAAGISTATVKMEWASAKAWLYRELTGGTTDGFRTMETSR